MENTLLKRRRCTPPSQGLRKTFSGDETNGKRRTYYRITETGRRYYAEKCEEWKVTKEVVEQFIRL